MGVHQVTDLAVDSGGLARIPIQGHTICAGFPSPGDDFLESALDLPHWLVPNPPASFLLNMSGASMIKGGIHDCDVALVNRAYRSKLKRENISVLNLTAVKSEDLLNHGKFASSEVVALLGRRLANGQVISDSCVGIGDRIVQTAVGAASTVATGAALAVSAPVALIDPQTRETYGEHLSNVGRGVGDTVSSTDGVVGRRYSGRLRVG